VVRRTKPLGSAGDSGGDDLRWQIEVSALGSIVRGFAVPRGEAACLIAFAKVALDRGDYGRASRLLAATKANVGAEGGQVVSPCDSLIYDHCTEILR
jgi:hypothetical protein